MNKKHYNLALDFSVLRPPRLDDLTIIRVTSKVQRFHLSYMNTIFAGIFSRAFTVLMIGNCFYIGVRRVHGMTANYSKTLDDISVISYVGLQPRDRRQLIPHNLIC